MNILYIITKKNNLINPTTLESIKKVFQTGDELETDVASECFEVALNGLIASKYEEYKAKGISHVVVVPDGSTLGENYRVVMNQYVTDETIVYLPIAQYLESTDGNDPAFKGLLNTCMWKPYGISNEYGFVSQELAIKQIDTTLYGAPIPLEVLKKYPLKTKIKYYSFFEYITRIVNRKIVVKGIPKVVMFYITDDTVSKVSQQEKVIYFTTCQKVYLSDEDSEVEVANKPTIVE